MGKIDVTVLAPVIGSRYPAPHDAPCKLRENKQLGKAAGLTQFGVNLTRLPPGAWSSQRHWHAKEDEFIYMLEGEAVLVTDAGDEILRPGDCAGFKGGVRDAHCLQNRSERDVVFLTVGTRDNEDWGEYPDIGMKFLPGNYTGDGGMVRTDGSPIT